MGMKVLVRSRYREATVRTTRDLSRDEKNRIVETNAGYRQFVNSECYMTMQEAAELVDSGENKAHIDAGLPALYYYPAGMPVPVDENHGGPLNAPMSQDGLVANNPMQNSAAKRVSEEADRQIAVRAKNAQSASAPAFTDSVPLVSKMSEPSDSTPVKIENPDISGNSDMFADVPTFRDEKAAADRR